MKIKTFFILVLIVFCCYKIIDHYNNTNLSKVLRMNDITDNSLVNIHDYDEKNIVIVFHKVQVNQNQLLGYSIFKYENRKWKLIDSGAKPNLHSSEIDFSFVTFGIDREHRLGLVYGVSSAEEDSIVLTTRNEELLVPTYNYENLRYWFHIFSDPKDMNIPGLQVHRDNN